MQRDNDVRALVTGIHPYEIAPGTGSRRLAIAEIDVAIGVGDRLVSTLMPTFADQGSTGNAHDWQDGGYAGTGVVVDLVLDDGSRLSDHGARDQHGVPVAALEQGGSRTLVPDQANRRTVDLSAFAGRRVVAVELEIEAAAHDVARGRVSAIEIERHDPGPRDPVDHVLTTRGSNSRPEYSRGNTVPLTGLPNAFAFVTPVTDARDPNQCYRYDVDDEPRLEAFAVCRLPHRWLGDYGILQLFPARTPEADPARRGLTFDRRDESARPHRYDVRFREGIDASLAPTMHAAVAAFTFRDGGGVVLFDQIDDDGALEFGADAVSGYASHRSWAAEAASRVFFVAEFDRPVVESGLFVDGEHPATSGWVRFDLAPGDTATLRIATSLVSVDQARRNLALDIPTTDGIAEVAERGRRIWNERLGIIRVEGASDDQLTTLYSNLFRLFLYPSLAAENAGTAEAPRWVHVDLFGERLGPDEPGRTGRRVVDGPLYVTNGFWDTYRTAWPAYALLDPELCARLLDGFVQHYRDGGWMSRWSAPGYADCMVGTSSDVVLADAALKGVPLLDPVDAYDSALRDATVPSPDERVGRKGLGESAFTGFASTAVPEGMSWTLEGAVNDFGLARLSAWMLERADPADPRRDEYAANERYFAGRAAAYAVLFDAEAGFFQGRKPDGAFRSTPDHHDPRVWGGDYTETNAWGMAFTAPHDGAGLAALYGGAAALERKLDAFFATPETGRVEFAGDHGRVIHEMTEARDVRMGMFGMSNQPAHHIPFMYAFTPSPHRTQALTREVLRRLYLGSEIGQGYPGDEDNGEMSAWWIFAALGFYPLTVGAPEYVLTAPLFERATVALPSGAEIVVEARGQGLENVYIQAVRVDGEPWERVTIDHARLVAGCRIEVELGPDPSGWGTGSAPASLSDGAPHVWRDLATPETVAGSDGVGRVFDDSSATELSIETGWEAGVDLDVPTEARLYTVTAGADPGRAPASWVLEGDAGDGWIELDRRESEPFRWARQTRPFLVARPGAHRRYRLRFRGAATLSQLEFLVETPLP
jgi:predicted alpha-1,2-mannosidase